MLSILIPVYNFNVVRLVQDLANQCNSCNVLFEIICLDDGSSNEYKQENIGLKNIPNTIYEELPLNVGRSIIRNLLAKKAKYDYLLFLDCDSTTNDSYFISKYIENMRENCLVYGGRNYALTPPKDTMFYFRWWYGVNRETIDDVTRNKHPYRSFMTNNFLIPKAIYQQIKLDESLIGYGHEDTLFGIELMKAQFPIIHISNPLCHIGLESFEQFISKTEEGIDNLNQLIENGKIDDSVKLFKVYKILRKLGLENLIYFYYERNKNRILEQLKKEKPNLRWFDFYKLGYLISLRKG